MAVTTADEAMTILRLSRRSGCPWCTILHFLYFYFVLCNMYISLTYTGNSPSFKINEISYLLLTSFLYTNPLCSATSKLYDCIPCY
jgi:hypothetical protein